MAEFDFYIGNFRLRESVWETKAWADCSDSYNSMAYASALEFRVLFLTGVSK